jgi:hypothetical protein
MPTEDTDSPSATMFDIVRQFATDLANFRGEEAKSRDDLKQEVTAQLTAARHDIYSSILYLEQQGVRTETKVEQQRIDSIEWRAAERLARETGQRVYRVLVIVALVLSSAALIVSLAVAAVMLTRVF